MLDKMDRLGHRCSSGIHAKRSALRAINAVVHIARHKPLEPIVKQGNRIAVRSYVCIIRPLMQTIYVRVDQSGCTCCICIFLVCFTKSPKICLQNYKFTHLHPIYVLRPSFQCVRHERPAALLLTKTTAVLWA